MLSGTGTKRSRPEEVSAAIQSSRRRVLESIGANSPSRATKTQRLSWSWLKFCHSRSPLVTIVGRKQRKPSADDLSQRLQSIGPDHAADILARQGRFRRAVLMTEENLCYSDKPSPPIEPTPNFDRSKTEK